MHLPLSSAPSLQIVFTLPLLPARSGRRRLQPRSLSVLFGSLALLLLNACSDGASSEPSEPSNGASTVTLTDAEWKAEGAARLQPFKSALMGALMEALPDGPEAAIQACQMQAPGLPDAASGSTWTLGRTSHKVRNPDNAPEPWMEAFLETYVAAEPDQMQAHSDRLEDGSHVYVEPIRMQGLCLTCHGPSLISEALAAAYPEDAATGFAEGDFRGMFWVRFDPDYEPDPSLALPPARGESPANPHG
jgi:hypothetical protein